VELHGLHSRRGTAEGEEHALLTHAGQRAIALLKRLELPHHRVHDARHFYAVRAIRAGTPYELVAKQLGHADVAMVAKVYGRFKPDHDERDRWELAADALDRADAARAEARADGQDRVDR